MALGPWNVRTLLVSVGLFVLAVGTRFPRVLIFASMACYGAMMLNPSLVAVPGVVDLRVIGLLLVVYMAMLRGRLPRFRVLRGGIFPATLMYLLLGTALIPTAQDMGAAVDGLLGTAATMGYAWVLLCAGDEREIRQGIGGVATIMVLGSLVLVVVDPSTAIIQGRWVGLTANANTLGFFAGIYLLSSRPERTWMRVPAVVAVLVGCASRASTFALGIVAGPKLLAGQPRRVRRAVTVLAVVVAIPIVYSIFFSGADNTGGAGAEVNNSLARTSNSRIDEWREGIDIVIAHPATGLGVGSQPDLVSSSVITPLVEVGVLAVVPLGLIVMTALSKVNQPLTAFRSIFFFLLINGVFEMWLFAGGSMIFMVFLVAAYDPEAHQLRRRSSAALTGRATTESMPDSSPAPSTAQTRARTVGRVAADC